MKHLKTLERAEANKESEETLAAVELPEVEVKAEEVERRPEMERRNLRKKEATWIWRKPDKVGRRRWTTLSRFWRMLQFGSWEEATSKAGKAPTTTKRIDRIDEERGRS